METITSESILLFTVRIILGALFFMQGYDKVIRVKMPGVINTFKYEFGIIKMPYFIIVVSAYLSSFIELICGLTLIFGLYTQITLCLLGFDLIMVSVAFSIISPVWDMRIVFPRLLLWCLLMVMPRAYDIFSLDHFMVN